MENFIKPAAVEMARILCGDAVANKLAIVPLSNETIKWRIQKISKDVLQPGLRTRTRRTRQFWPNSKKKISELELETKFVMFEFI